MSKPTSFASAPRLDLAAAIAMVGAVVVVAYPADAQTFPYDEQVPPSPNLVTQGKSGWNVTLGIGAASAPEYEGADNRKFQPVPIVAVKYGDWFFASPKGIEVAVINWHRFRAGPLIGLKGGRNQSKDLELRGLGDIPVSLEGGGFLSYSIGPIALRGEVRQAITHTANGLTAGLAIKYHHWIVPGKLDFSLGPELRLADDAHTMTLFGVTPIQSAASGLPIYAPHGGLTDAGGGATMTYFFTRHVLLHTFVNFREIVGDAANSPIVEQKAQTVFGTAIAYHF